MKRKIHSPFLLLSSLILAGTIPPIALASEDAVDNRSVITTRSMGLSYPLVASVSVGLNAPLINDSEKRTSRFGALAVQANVDLGIGGGMASGGIFIPVGGDRPAEARAIIVKAAVLRTWALDLGVELNRTYTGVVVEYFQAAAGMGGKIGVGYFRGNASTLSPDHDFFYLYAGLGL